MEIHSPELLKGTLQTIVLKVLKDNGKMYGYEITQLVRDLSNNRILLTEGALYPTLHRLVAEGLLRPLTAFTAEQRTKEIGIRKVLGASVSSIVLLLSREFGKLIVIAFVLATPLAWLAVDWWLQNYTYKVEVGIFVYMLAGTFSFLIAWLTMGYQSIRAATSNPAQSLRSE
jgi:putative ABC transport system permease protein